MQESLKSLVILFKAQHVIENQVKKSLENTALSVNEFAALEALANKGRLTTSQLIDLVLIPNSSMTYVLDTLNEKGYINRAKDNQDRRIQWISLTAQGQRVFSAVYSYHHQHMRKFFDILEPDEEIEMQRLLKKVGYAAQGQL